MNTLRRRVKENKAGKRKREISEGQMNLTKGKLLRNDNKQRICEGKLVKQNKRQGKLGMVNSKKEGR